MEGLLSNQKDKSIIDVIHSLMSIININEITIVDYWEADLCSIGLRKGNKLVYISTYNLEDNGYDYDFERIDTFSLFNNRTIKEVRGASKEKLTEEVFKYLVNNQKDD